MGEYVFFNRTVGVTFRGVGIIAQNGYKQDIVIESITADSFMALRAERDGARAACQSALEWLGEKPTERDKRWPHYRSKAALMEQLEAAIRTAGKE